MFIIFIHIQEHMVFKNTHLQHCLNRFRLEICFQSANAAKFGKKKPQTTVFGVLSASNGLFLHTPTPIQMPE